MSKTTRSDFVHSTSYVHVDGQLATVADTEIERLPTSPDWDNHRHCAASVNVVSCIQLRDELTALRRHAQGLDKAIEKLVRKLSTF